VSALIERNDYVDQAAGLGQRSGAQEVPVMDYFLTAEREFER
jgi:hypothetical protein